MSHAPPQGILNALAERQAAQALRRLVPLDLGAGVDLCSNDYLGLARFLGERDALQQVVLRQLPQNGVLGATGSRLVSGSSKAHCDLEHFIAQQHDCEAALLFGSGYEANLGLLGAIGSRSDTIIYDKLLHASMRDGVRLSLARSFSFKHNDLGDLRDKLMNARGERFVAVESLYSMDGDYAPLGELCAVCEEFGAFLIVDEAHATGVFGEQGQGLVQQAGLQERVFARVHTFGKALGFRGAVVVGSETLREYLINFARTFVYSTAPDLLSLALVRRAYEVSASMSRERSMLAALIEQVRALRGDFPNLEFIDSTSPIQGVIISGNDRVLAVEERLWAEGFFARAIRSPTVPLGRERIRLCIHAFNSIGEVRAALSVISAVLTVTSARAVMTEAQYGG